MVLRPLASVWPRTVSFQGLISSSVYSSSRRNGLMRAMRPSFTSTEAALLPEPNPHQPVVL